MFMLKLYNANVFNFLIKKNSPLFHTFEIEEITVGTYMWVWSNNILAFSFIL